MSSPKRQRYAAVAWSVVLHGAIFGALAMNVDFKRTPQPAALAIEAVVVDETLLARAEQQRIEEQRAREEAARRAREEEARRQREAEERARQEELRRQEEARRAEQERRAREEAERRAREEAERKAREEAERKAREEAERKAREEAERKAREEAERKAREEAERKAREEAERRAREEAERRRQAELEAELQRAAEAEAERLAAIRSGELDEYSTMLRTHIERNWNRPPSARPGIDCTVQVTQLPSGDVVSARVVRCNGDDAVVRSIEAAVLRASPLPLPRNRALFERVLNIHFKPDD